jgi:hypothetical protein
METTLAAVTQQQYGMKSLARKDDSKIKSGSHLNDTAQYLPTQVLFVFCATWTTKNPSPNKSAIGFASTIIFHSTLETRLMPSGTR